MARWQLKNLRSLNIAAHRDFGYFLSALLIAYCISGLALNHVDEWNPDFIITKVAVKLPRQYTAAEVNKQTIEQFGELVGEKSYKVYDFPTNNQVKIYYDNSSLHLNLETGAGMYEKISRRPLFYQSNALHRNSLTGWKWAADVFAIMLIIMNVTGLLIARGKYGITGRGKWLIAAGFLPPLLAFILNALL